ncbi:hypothetical protein TIFTF001_029161 [Ficus carica]|uniref:Uncharacterized protein n=1 Tax=Ficus carica TaxID=3494 RepID=A0AA88J2H8_FICCA|nr:hypothetical protein TIFTF001_029161 [Ficus carica]
MKASKFSCVVPTGHKGGFNPWLRATVSNLPDKLDARLWRDDIADCEIWTRVKVGVRFWGLVSERGSELGFGDKFQGRGLDRVSRQGSGSGFEVEIGVGFQGRVGLGFRDGSPDRGWVSGLDSDPRHETRP